MAEFGVRMRVARARKNLSLADAGSAIGVSAQAVSKWETGGSPSSSKLIAIAKLYDCSLEWLMDPDPLDFQKPPPDKAQ